MRDYLIGFVTESLAIEGIDRRPTFGEIDATDTFLQSPLQVMDVVALVGAYQSDARIRDRAELNVRVGEHVAPTGGPGIVEGLDGLLRDIRNRTLTPWWAHVRYETLHPFTDGNGRSGRAVWLWQMMNEKRPVGLSFLQHFYYQTLAQTPARRERF